MEPGNAVCVREASLFNRDRWIDTLRQELAFEAANVTGHPYVEAPPKIGEANTAYGKMRHLNNDKYIGRSLALYGEYSPGEHTILRAILNPGDVVVEAGANIGALSGVIAEAINPGGYLYAFEPQKEYFECLSFNLRSIPSSMYYRAICAALGSEYGEIEIPGVETETVSAPSWEKNKTSLRAVMQTTVDSLNLLRLKLLKVDVDGPEHEILLGAEQTIDRCRPVIFVEYDKIDKYPDMLSWVDSKGYRIYKTEPAMWLAPTTSCRQPGKRSRQPRQHHAAVQIPAERHGFYALTRWASLAYSDSASRTNTTFRRHNMADSAQSSVNYRFPAGHQSGVAAGPCRIPFLLQLPTEGAGPIGRRPGIEARGAVSGLRKLPQ